MARHWRAFLLSACGLSVPVGALGRIEAPVSAAKNPVPDAAVARVVLFGAMKAIERRRSSIQKSYSTVFALVVCAALFHKRLKLILSGIGHSDVAKVLNRTSDTSAVVKVVLAHKCSTAEVHHDS